MKIRLKVYNDFGKDWIAVGLLLQGDDIMIQCMRDDAPAFVKLIPVAEWNALPHYWFTQGDKVAAKTNVQVKNAGKFVNRDQFLRDLES